MTVDLTKLRAASFLPGLQTVGTSATTATVDGLLPAKGVAAGNLSGSFLLYFPNPRVMSLIRVSLPDAHGDLVNWFPVMGGAFFYDQTANWYLSLSVYANPSGRLVSYSFYNINSADVTFSGFRIQAYAHMYTYPWAAQVL